MFLLASRYCPVVIIITAILMHRPPPPSCRIADKEQRLGVESGSIRIDERGVKIVGWIGE